MAWIALPEPACRYARRGLAFAALALGLQLPADLAGQGGVASAAVRLGWTALLLGLAAVISPRRPRLTLASLHAGAVASAAAAAVMVACCGGTEGPRFTFLAVLPLLAAVLLPALPWLAATMGGAVVAFGAALVLREGRPLAWLAEWILLALVSTGFAVAGALAHRRSACEALGAAQDAADVTVRLAESDRRRERAERLALAGRVAAGVAHEIANPLCFVKANVRFLQEHLAEAGAAGEEAREVAAETLQGVERIAQIVADMRGLAREGAQPIGSCDVAALIGEAVRLASGRQPAVRVEAVVEPGLPRAVASPRLLVQALVNLVVNGADAAAGAPMARRWVRVSARARHGGVLLEVADGGPGFSPEARARLFEPFFTTKGTAGTGLGLALTRENVQRCQGTLELAPEGAPGAVFTIRLHEAAGELGEAVPTPVPFPAAAAAPARQDPAGARPDGVPVQRAAGAA